MGSRELTQLTNGDYDDSGPVWSPEGRRIAFASNAEDSERSGIFVRQAEGAGSDRQLTSTEGIQVPTSWSPDGERVAYSTAERTSGAPETRVVQLPHTDLDTCPRLA